MTPKTVTITGENLEVVEIDRTPTPPVPVQRHVQVHERVFVRTLSMYYLGIVAQTEPENNRFLKLVDAKWVADTGQFAKFLKEPTTADMTAYPNPVYLNFDHILEITVV